MSEIPRYRMANNLGESDNDNGSWVKYEDHTVAMQEATIQQRHLIHRVPITPAELIPTLKEHEWVRFRVSTSGRLFTSTTYFDGDGSLCADDYQLRGSHAKSTAYNVNIESIERCEAPVVK
jgi:hypothetical protein